MAVLKKLLRRLGRVYLTYTPVHLGRYPIMEAIQKIASEPVYEIVHTKDRGVMKLRVDDWVQYCLYYNLYEPKYEKSMHALMAGARTILDIGANIGQYSLLFGQNARKVLAFEPMPELAEQLRENVRLNNLEQIITVVEAAVSDIDGEVVIHAAESSNSGMASLISSTSNRSLQVEAVTIDNYVQRNSVGNIDFIKMDIEGAELHALRGMIGLLREQKPPLVLEMNEEMMSKAGYSYSNILDLLRPLGYAPYAMLKAGLQGPLDSINSVSENFAFLTPGHVAKPRVQKILI
jgi:FkbM family methyltransferase